MLGIPFIVRVDKPSCDAKRLVMVRYRSFTEKFSPLHRKVAEMKC